MEQAPPQTQRVRPYAPYPVSVDEYVRFKQDGYLVVKGLVARAEVQAFNEHTDAVMNGEIRIPGLTVNDQSLSLAERRKAWDRVHMAHRVMEIHERFLLHPRIIDVLEALIGPDVLALQTMLFFKQPGQAGQGYHQDSYYIPTQPDSLCGAWLALDPATEENGCLWFTVGSQNEPIYPDGDGVTKNGDRLLDNIDIICNASNPDTDVNTVARIAAKYPGAEVKVEAEPGDVVFFGGHVLHRSHTNHATYSRRAFVGHYCNARSRVPWNHGIPYVGTEANHEHILARGTTHLPYAQPKFGTLCAANAPELYGQRIFDNKPHSMMSDGNNGYMIAVPHGDSDHDD
ncbi:MAG: phytanoyl-CoA dioxygenase family protein [Chloroflexota bacterium]|nr:phytanoyl-CoA dioxygenase family protein [Chloroflexota bacterium]